MMNSHLRLVTPATEIRTVTLKRPKNAELRSREYLTPTEVDSLINASKANRWGHRDSLMISMAYRHGLRATELVNLKWSQVDFNAAQLHGIRPARTTGCFSRRPTWSPCGGCFFEARARRDGC